MKKEITEILNKLIIHDISKSEAVESLSLLCVTSNMDAKVKSALISSVNAIYFNDSSDYLTSHYRVVRELTDIEDLNEEVVTSLFRTLNQMD